jgi:hypothetical protein
MDRKSRDQGVVRGRIEWDDDRGGRVPLLVIDGREIDWDEFGRMLMSFEGSQFKLHITDKSEELCPRTVGRGREPGFASEAELPLGWRTLFS